MTDTSAEDVCVPDGSIQRFLDTNCKCGKSMCHACHGARCIYWFSALPPVITATEIVQNVDATRFILHCNEPQNGYIDYNYVNLLKGHSMCSSMAISLSLSTLQKIIPAKFRWLLQLWGYKTATIWAHCQPSLSLDVLPCSRTHY